MKLTDEVAKALQNCVEGFGSIAELSRRTGVRIELLSRYLDRQTKSIEQDTWGQLYPLIKPYLNTAGGNSEMPKFIGSSARMSKDLVSLICDERILLDAFTALQQAQQQELFAALPQISEIPEKYQQITSLSNDEKRLLSAFAALSAEDQQSFLARAVKLAEEEMIAKRRSM